MGASTCWPGRLKAGRTKNSSMSWPVMRWASRILSRKWRGGATAGPEASLKCVGVFGDFEVGEGPGVWGKLRLK